MNIFEALSSGKGSINEENISSFLAYLLNPNEDHGMKDDFIKGFLEKIGIEGDDASPDEIKGYNLQLELGVNVINNENKKRYIDIVFETKKYIIGIENKINPKSFKDTQQLQDESEGLINQNQSKKNVIICLLAPKNCKEQYTNGKFEYEKFRYLNWEQVLELLNKIISKETYFDDYIKQTLNAFIHFMKNSLVDQIDFGLSGMAYKIIKTSSKSGKTLTYKVEVKTEQGYKGVKSNKKIIATKLDEMNKAIRDGDVTNTLGEKLFKLLQKEI